MRHTTRRAYAQTLEMAFQDCERLPAPGDTVIMAGNFGVNYAVTVHRILSERRSTTGDHTIVLTVKATRRPIAESER